MTYSIVARDPDSGAFGVAVQSAYFSVGAVVPWVAAGVGAVRDAGVVRSRMPALAPATAGRCRRT